MAVRDLNLENIGGNNPNENETFGGGGGIPGGEDVFIDAGGGGGGGGSSSGPKRDNNPTTTNTFIFNISANQTNFVSFVNGNVVPNNKSIRITRESLAQEDKKITVSKKGFLNNEYYKIQMIDDDAPIIKNINVSDTPLGLSTKDIVLTKYRGGKVVGTPLSIRDTTTNNIAFSFVKGDTDTPEEPEKYTVKFNITGEGTPVSILKNANKSAEFFPKSGESTYEDVENTKYLIRASDSSSYRITSITIVAGTNKPVVLDANPGETLETSLTLNLDYEISITTERVEQPLDELDPQISLVNADPREYNINEKSGVPLLIQKNEDVQAITIVVGDDILEFDDLDEGDVIGLTIPHNVFSKIGQYNIKLFPFSFDDYENQVREEEDPITITPKVVTPKFIQEEKESPIKDPTPEDIVNPYKPTPNKPNRGGGGGRGQEQFISEDQFGIDRGFGSGDDFDERNRRPNRNLNYL